jgi:hypothetical protein
MLRHVAYAAFVAAFAALVWQGVQGWSRTVDKRTHQTGSTDESALRVGSLTYEQKHRLAMMGYPWERHSSTLVKLKRDLPPDPANPTAEDQRKDIERLGPEYKLPLPEGRMTWPQMLGRLRTGLAQVGVKVMTAEPAPPESFYWDVPANDWVMNQSLFFMTKNSQDSVRYFITSEGLAVGTDAAVNKLALDAKLVELRRRVAPEHADPALDAEYSPDVVEATVVALANQMTAQTGVEVIADQSYWDEGIGFIWRGQPRKLRAALDEMTSHRKIRAYWRFHDGRVWILRPELP